MLRTPRLRQSSKPSKSQTAAAQVDEPTVRTLDGERLFREIVDSHRDLVNAERQFNEVSDPRLVDHMVFRLDAAEQHFRYLLQQARVYGVSVSGVRFEWAEED